MERIAKTTKELDELLRNDYREFLKGHSKHEDDYISFSEWIDEWCGSKPIYGWVRMYGWDGKWIKHNSWSTAKNKV